MKNYNNLDWVTTTVRLTKIISFKHFVTGTSDVGLHLTVPTRKENQEILFVIDINYAIK